MKKLFNKGFTLIELLVVIAIIGILSSIVLASLSSARTKGEDAAIQSTLSNMRAQAELYYSTYNSYGPALTQAACPTATGNGNIFASSTTGGLWTLVSGLNDRATNANTSCTVGASGVSYAVAAKLKGAGTYCVDSTGASKLNAGATTAAGAITSGACN